MKHLLLALVLVLFPFTIYAQPGGDPGGGGGGNPGGGSSSTTIGSASSTGYFQSSGTNTASGETYTSTNSDENAVQITGGTFTMTDCTVQKLSGETGDSDGSSFYGINSAVYCAGSGSTLNISGGTITTSTKGANAIIAYDYGTINVSDVTIVTTDNLSRGIHATGGGVINATNLTISTASTNCSVIATDRGGGTVTVDGGTYTTTGADCAVIYSTGTMTVSNATGSSSSGEVGVIEGDNSITINSCDMTSGSSERGIMILQSGSGDSEGYNGVVTVNDGTLTLTDTSAPLCEIPTNVTGTLTLKDVTLTVPSGVLMYVDYNTRWETYGGVGNLVLSTDSEWSYTGDVNADEYGTVNVTVGSGVTWNGSIDNTNVASSTSVTVSGIWVLTSDSYVDELVVNSGAVVYTNGYNLNYSSLSGDGTISTGISNITVEASSAVSDVYSIDGRLVKANATTLEGLREGIYIFKGKKVFVND